jgi:hypothetical protein
VLVKNNNPLLLFTIGVSADVQTCSSPARVFSVETPKKLSWVYVLLLPWLLLPIFMILSFKFFIFYYISIIWMTLSGIFDFLILHTKDCIEENIEKDEKNSEIDNIGNGGRKS